MIFAPEEILLLRTQPAARRKFIDRFIAQFVPAHKKVVRDYEAVLSQRNAILSDIELTEHARRTQLAPWDEQQASLGAKIMCTRAEWIARINEHLPTHYRAIAAADGEARFQYEPNVGEEALGEGEGAVAATLRLRIAERAADEAVRQISLVGPQRDDLVAEIGDGSVKRFASQGQHRSFVLALTIAEVELHKEIEGRPPLLLLDDVASELDPERNRRFFEYVQASQGQVFITTTTPEDVKIASHASIVRYTIHAGTAKKA